MNLSGTWVGFYQQGVDEVPIEVTLDHTGDQLQGTMTEPEIERELSISTVALGEGWPPGQDEVVVKTLRSQFPASGNAPIRAYSKLPANSRLTGRVVGERVEFEKTYLGICASGFLVGEERVLFEREGHAVSYLGHLNRERDRIEGRWSITASSGRTVVGAFGLKRSPTPTVEA